jgi:uncharacterized membrane protein YtjA (UPF0391 family)
MSFTRGQSRGSGYFDYRNIGAQVQRFPDAAIFGNALRSEKFKAALYSGLFRVLSMDEKRGANMLRWTLIFLVIALIAALLGFGDLAGDASSIARILFFLFLVLTLIGLLFSLVTGRKPPMPPAV